MNTQRKLMAAMSQGAVIAVPSITCGINSRGKIILARMMAAVVKLVLTVCILNLAIPLQSALAATITLNSTVQGRGTNGTGTTTILVFNGASPFYTNSFVGWITGGGGESRSAWQFEIPDLTGLTVTSAILRLGFEGVFNFTNAGGSVGGTEAFSLYDANENTFNGDFTGAAATTLFNDLGTGSYYGSNTLSSGFYGPNFTGSGQDSGQAGTTVDTLLSPAALSDINSSSLSSFALGMRSTSIDSTSIADFSATDGFKFDLPTRTYELILTTAPVPVPAAAWLLGSGLLGLIGIARKKRV